jgi:hypothetical protein
MTLIVVPLPTPDAISNSPVSRVPGSPIPKLRLVK